MTDKFPCHLCKATTEVVTMGNQDLCHACLLVRAEFQNVLEWVDALDSIKKERDALKADLAEALALIGRIVEWTHKYGAALKARRADTYGEGMRDAKYQVSALLSKHAKGDE